MRPFDKLPKSVKKTIRYISQDVKTLEELEELEKTIYSSIERKKEKLKN